MSAPRTLLVENGPDFAAAGLAHRVRKPSVTGPYRAVVMLHGRSGDEGVMWVFARTLSDDWLIVAPRGLKRDLQAGFAWHPRQRDQWPSLHMFDEAVGAVTRLIRALPDLYDADPDQVYLMGFSQGAATAYATAMRHPGLVQGIAGLVGFVPTECGDVSNIRPLMGLPIFMAVGKDDPFIPMARSEDCARTLRAVGAQLDYRAYDTGHRLNADGVRDLKRWWAERDHHETPKVLRSTPK